MFTGYGRNTAKSDQFNHFKFKAQNNGQQVAGHDDRPNIF